MRILIQRSLFLIFILTSLFSFKSYSKDYICPESNIRYLTDDEINVLSNDELRFAINEIYARRGRKFDTKDLNEYFSSKSWYTPKYSYNDFDELLFNRYEKTNLERLAAKRNNSNLSSNNNNHEDIVTTSINNSTNDNGFLFPTGNTDLDANSFLPYATDYGKAYLRCACEEYGRRPIFNWNYPEKFKKHRNKIFKLMFDYAKYRIEHREKNVSDIISDVEELPEAIPVKSDFDLGGTYLYETNVNPSAYYYGELKDGKPNGYGIIIIARVAFYGGIFKNGRPTDYGIWINTGGVEWECTEPQMVTTRSFHYHGSTILYYSADKDQRSCNYARKCVFYDSVEFSDGNFEDDSTLIDDGNIKTLYGHLSSYFYLTLQPMVFYEGETGNNFIKSKGSFYYDKYATKSYHGEVVTMECDSCYGPLCYTGETLDGEASGKGTLYKANGDIEYEDSHFDGVLRNID